MKKILAAVFSVVLAVMMLAGCSALEAVTGGGGDGTNDGKIGDVMSTYFFDYKVLDAKAADSYADYTPEEGNKLIILEIETANTFDESIPMFDYDYQLQWGARSNEDTFAVTLDALDDACAPLEMDLAADESMTYLYIYEVPADVDAFEVCYLEEFEGEEEDGDIHYVAFTL